MQPWGIWVNKPHELVAKYYINIEKKLMKTMSIFHGVFCIYLYIFTKLSIINGYPDSAML